MPNNYSQSVSVSETRFTKAPMGELEFSTMVSAPQVLTTFSAGEIVPIYCGEVLPHDTISIDLDFVIRQATALVPSMGRMIVDIYAFEEPNRVVNQSWKMVQGENATGSWIPNEVTLAPLLGDEVVEGIQIPVCSVADYYGFPTQDVIPSSILRQCHDLKFRGYLDIYNNFFRDQNYQPPIAFSKLNIYNGFLQPTDSAIGVKSWKGTSQSLGNESNNNSVYDNDDNKNGAYGFPAIQQAIMGSGEMVKGPYLTLPYRVTEWSALDRPLKANKLHDYFTSVLPSPQKAPSVVIGAFGQLPVLTSSLPMVDTNGAYPLQFGTTTGSPIASASALSVQSGGTVSAVGTASNGGTGVTLRNAYVDGNAISFDISDLRFSAAVQQVYEILGRGGSRYREFINSFFGLDVDDPFSDVPRLLGHIRRDLDLYQVAQTSASQEGSSQGNLAAFGYTNKGGSLFTRTFLEHGYIHIFAVVRHKNVYPSLLGRDNFRMSMLDFYTYPLANISQQPVYTREINPFAEDSEGVFGYQEAWAEYRMEPDRVTGYMRSGIDQSLAYWTYSDVFDKSLQFADGEFMKSNSAQVLNESIALSDTLMPQFKAQFFFKITKERPMPTYSVGGLDIL